ncbi:hypothetical protein CFD26_106585 [Aspergillus turcosus]|uniref:Heterokaryon incompatibility domain-containing protein n=1 Tax=Aspergillus turcosus TaxID=1245748 RepID=A0A3R7FU08_9EURO|nr:hypothetical protein CFD26_106585 [Aspergillus turcosus]
MLAVVPEHLFGREENERDILQKHVPEFMIPAYPGPSASCISGRKVHADKIDFTFINDCIAYCNAHHRCGPPLSSTPDWITVYDYRNKKAVSKQLPFQYIALSYVWGPKEEEPCLSDGSSPQVIEDVIKIAEQLEIPYVWVDSYCMEQHDPHKMQQQLNSMHRIYKNAYLTVVDGAGYSRHNGLYGISKQRNVSQTTLQLAGRLWISTLGNPQTLVQNSPWITRGWTYQEAIASPRLLIFTEEQIYFECKAMRCWESIHIPLDCHHRKDKLRFLDSLCEPLFCQYTRNPKEFDGRGDFPRYIKHYTQRSLTNSHDALNAIAGVLRFLEKDNGHTVYNFWGIPLYAPEQKDPWALTTGMAWTLRGREINGSREPILRRHTFPSWSWAGWQGVVESFELGKFNHYVTHTSILIQSKKESQASLSWAGYWKAEGGMEMDRRINLWASGLGPSTNRDEPYNYPWLEITTGIIRVKLRYASPRFIEETVAKWPSLAGRIKPGFFIVPPDEGSRYTPIDFPDNDPELSTERADDICQREWDCMLLGYTPERGYKEKECPFVIMLNYSQRRKVTERVWGGRLWWNDGWEKSSDFKERSVRLH